MYHNTRYFNQGLLRPLIAQKAISDADLPVRCSGFGLGIRVQGSGFGVFFLGSYDNAGC